MITDHPTFDGPLPIRFHKFEIISTVIEMFRHYNKVEICSYNYSYEYDLPPNYAFRECHRWWIRKGESKELRPLGCVAPIGY